MPRIIFIPTRQSFFRPLNHDLESMIILFSEYFLFMFLDSNFRFVFVREQFGVVLPITLLRIPVSRFLSIGKSFFVRRKFEPNLAQIDENTSIKPLVEEFLNIVVTMLLNSVFLFYQDIFFHEKLSPS